MQTTTLAWHDRVQHAADVLGLVPGLNMPAEIVSGLISLYKGDLVGFGLSLAGLMPVEGEWAVALKLARAAKQGTDLATRAARAARQTTYRTADEFIAAEPYARAA